MKLIVALFAGLLLSPLCVRAASVLMEDMTWPEVQRAIASGRTTAIYYAGSTEQNGPHMVLGKHNFIARHVAQRIAEQLGNALVYPVMPFAPTGDAGSRTDHMRFPGSVSVLEETFRAVASDVATSARAAGFRNIVLMGDHGGGQQALQKLAEHLNGQWAARGVHVHYISDVYYKSQQEMQEYLAARALDAGAHAGLPDTSELMALDTTEKWIRKDLLMKGDGRNGVDGDPRQASAELGRVLLSIKVKNAVAQIHDLVGRNH